MIDFINICAITDAKYLKHTILMLNSLILRTKRNMHIYLILDEKNVFNTNINALLIPSPFNSQIHLHIIKFSQTIFKSYQKNISSSYITSSTFIKLFLPNIIPNNVEKLLYIDSDCIITHDISNMYDIDITHKYLGLSMDIGIEFIIKQDAFIQKFNEWAYVHSLKSSKYFNAGVILFNLKMLRQFNLLNKAIDKYLVYKDIFILNEQDIINSLFDDSQIYEFDYRFNFQKHPLENAIAKANRYYQKNDYTLDSFENESSIIHYCGNKTKIFKNINNTFEYNKLIDRISSLFYKKQHYSNVEVSFIMPFRNAEKTIFNTLMSICRQTLNNIEIICINDKSTDHSPNIVRSLSRTDSRIKLIDNKKQLGPGQSRNIGLKTAIGNYIFFIDADDLLPNDNTMQALVHLAKQNNANIIGGPVQFNDVINNKTFLIYSEYNKNVNWKNKFSMKHIEFADYIYDFFFQRFLFKREFIVSNSIQFPNNYYYEDPVFMIYAMQKNNGFFAVNFPTYSYYKYSEQNNKYDIDRIFPSLLCNLRNMKSFAKTICSEQLRQLINYRITINYKTFFDTALKRGLISKSKYQKLLNE